jgi:hypothetical protein
MRFGLLTQWYDGSAVRRAVGALLLQPAAERVAA